MVSSKEDKILDTQSILSRLKQLFNVRHATELAERMKTNYRTLQNWKTRKSIPAEKVASVCQENGFDFQYVMLGVRPTENTQCAVPLSKLDALSQLSAADRAENIERPASTALKCTATGRICINPPSRQYSILDESGNKLRTIHSNQIVANISFEYEWLSSSLGLRPEYVLLIRVMEDNMSPWAHEGDLVIVDTSTPSAPNGGVVVIKYNDDMLLLRRYFRNADGTITLKCDTECCPPEKVTPGPDCFPTIIGRVVRRFVR